MKAFLQILLLAVVTVSWLSTPADARSPEMINGPSDPAHDGDPEGGWRGIAGGGAFVEPPDEPGPNGNHLGQTPEFRQHLFLPGVFPGLLLLHEEEVIAPKGREFLGTLW